jgi:hypothetical protein
VNAKQRKEVALAKAWWDLYHDTPEAYDAEFGVKKELAADASVSKEVAAACVDDPQLYDRVYSRPVS